MDGALIITPEVLGTGRKYLYEPYTDESTEEFSAMGITDEFIDQTGEMLPRGVMRGLHFQRKGSYGRLIAVTEGKALVVAVDMRPESKSWGAPWLVEMSAENEVMYYVPPYFAHGYLTLEKGTEVVLTCAGDYEPNEESGIIYDDEVLMIDWQFDRYDIDEKYLSVSPRDKRNKAFRMFHPNDLWINRPKLSKYALRSATRPIRHEE